MSDFADKLRLKEKAEEDIYFAQKDRELIDALQKRRLSKLADCGEGAKRQAAAFEERFEALLHKHRKKPWKLLRAYRKLLDDVEARCKRRG